MDLTLYVSAHDIDTSSIHRTSLGKQLHPYKVELYKEWK